MARLYANENFPLDCVLALRGFGHDVLTVAESGHAGIAWPDNQVLSFATADARAVITFNRRHFIKLHLDSAQHGGIIACTFDPDFAALANRINAAIMQSGQLEGLLIRINRS